MTAPTNEIHEFLIEELQERRKQFTDFVFRHGAFNCLIAGWLLSSQPAQQFLKVVPLEVRVAFGLLLAVYGLYFALWVIYEVRASREIFRRLSSTGYMESSLYRHLLIQPWFATTIAVLHVLFCIVMVYMLNVLPSILK
jgi:hypothetical protein